MDENNYVQEFDMQDTIPDEDQTDMTDVVGAEDFTITPNSEFNEENNIVRDAKDATTQNFVSENEASEPFVSVRYNHKNRDFTREEAIQFIQKGMHTENLRTKLEYLAKRQGVDVNTLVDKIVMAPEIEHRKHLEMLYGEGNENVEIGMAIYMQHEDIFNAMHSI